MWKRKTWCLLRICLILLCMGLLHIGAPFMSRADATSEDVLLREEGGWIEEEAPPPSKEAWELDVQSGFQIRYLAKEGGMVALREVDSEKIQEAGALLRGAVAHPDVGWEFCGWVDGASGERISIEAAYKPGVLEADCEVLAEFSEAAAAVEEAGAADAEGANKDGAADAEGANKDGTADAEGANKDGTEGSAEQAQHVDVDVARSDPDECLWEAEKAEKEDRNGGTEAMLDAQEEGQTEAVIGIRGDEAIEAEPVSQDETQGIAEQVQQASSEEAGKKRTKDFEEAEKQTGAFGEEEGEAVQTYAKEEEKPETGQTHVKEKGKAETGQTHAKEEAEGEAEQTHAKEEEEPEEEPDDVGQKKTWGESSQVFCNVLCVDRATNRVLAKSRQERTEIAKGEQIGLAGLPGQYRFDSLGVFSYVPSERYPGSGGLELYEEAERYLSCDQNSLVTTFQKIPSKDLTIVYYVDNAEEKLAGNNMQIAQPANSGLPDYILIGVWVLLAGALTFQVLQLFRGKMYGSTSTDIR